MTKPQIFEYLLSHRIGLGKFQYINFFALCFNEIIDGFDVVAMSIMMPILKHEFNMSNAETQFISSAFYLGMTLGAFFSTILPRVMGRRKTLILMGLCNTLACLMTARV
jgi:MFS family permease